MAGSHRATNSSWKDLNYDSDEDDSEEEEDESEEGDAALAQACAQEDDQGEIIVTSSGDEEDERSRRAMRCGAPLVTRVTRGADPCRLPRVAGGLPEPWRYFRRPVSAVSIPRWGP